MNRDPANSSRALSILDALEAVLDDELQHAGGSPVWEELAQKWHKRADELERRLYVATQRFSAEKGSLKDELQDVRRLLQQLVSASEGLVNTLDLDAIHEGPELERLQVAIQNAKATPRVP